MKMRVSIVNCVSTAADMMRFSNESLLRNAGTVDFDYVVVKWLASPEVQDYLNAFKYETQCDYPLVRVHVIEHQTDESIGYVPNLRAMMNDGFMLGFQLNDYCGLTNTDVYHGNGWLAGLVRYAAPQRIINSLHITAVPRALMQQDKLGIVPDQYLGIPEPGLFDKAAFDRLYEQHYKNDLITVQQGEFRHVATMPYLFHRQWWERCGPWDTTFDWRNQAKPPDECFFGRIDAAGAEFALTHSSIIYHAEGVERKRKRPPGAEHLLEE